MTRVERGLVLAAIILATLACVSWYTSVPSPVPVAQSSAGDVADIGVTRPESVDAYAREVAETDPFRLDRRPASVAYRPDLEGVSPPPKPARPQLALAGLVGGAALLDGVPGRPATVIVHAGDTLGGLRIRRIGRDTVIVSGADTTWRLTLRQAWQ
ncbi:MAG TPA: hypothetical protein VK733_08655 [Gemmatimonadaceae bacterium]|jgi:hypothetical protein|nr:hypothetical protein [Gemmatimonadaceae bacterium]